MLATMQNLALCYLWKELEGNELPPNDLREWFIHEKESDRGRFFSYLVEPESKIEKYYTLSADPGAADIAVLEGADIGSLNGNSSIRLPFNKPSGPRSPQIGPVIKRSYDRNKGSGPTIQILNTTLQSFERLSKSKEPWNVYFSAVLDVWTRKKLYYAGEQLSCEPNLALHKAVEIIPENKPVFLAFKDKGNCLPGDIAEYRQYLSTMLDADNKYTIKEAPPIESSCCPCCGVENIKIYPAGISKAGINIYNIDRHGAFPNITNSNAFLSYAICENCSDLLYIFKFHVINNFLSDIAGQETLMLPELYLNSNLLNRFLSNFNKYLELLKNASEKALVLERKRLVRFLINEQATCTIDIIWSKDSLKGQSIGNLSGQISDVLPSRLRAIDILNNNFEDISSAFFPKHRTDDFLFDLNLSFLKPLLKRPGGKKAKNSNSSRKLIEVKRLIAESIYKKKVFPEKRFWEETMVTAGWHIRQLIERENPELDCLYEGYSEKKNITWMTLSGWIRHLYMAVRYFIFMEVIKPMENNRTYSPEMEKLKGYFTDDCGITTNEKAYAFVLGILFGRVMQIQGARGVNVSANALTWLKRLTLSGKDLPEFYIKIREKLLAYEAEGNETVRMLIKEIGILGNKLGDNITLAQTPCCYFILLGQSIATDLFPKKETK